MIPDIAHADQFELNTEHTRSYLSKCFPEHQSIKKLNHGKKRVL